MPFEVGDVLLVPFPFTDQSATKKRPAVVVSGRDYNVARPDVILMAITSQFRPSADFGDLWLRDWRTAGLLKESAVKPIFATIEQRLILRRLGGLSPDDLEGLRHVIARIFA